MLVAKLVSLGSNTHCDHENSVKYVKVKPAYLTGHLEPLYEEIDTVIHPLVESYNKGGRIYGESSGLMYLAFEELYHRYGQNARFILLTRHPKDFVGSALARGFFSPDHPYPLEHIRARPDTELGRRWECTSAFEKCLWYWSLVNGMILRLFRTMPDELWKVLPVENLDLSASRRLYELLQIEGFDEDAVEQLLSTRINATPGVGDERNLNPWSVPMTVGDHTVWDRKQQEAYQRWIAPVIGLFYAESEEGCASPLPIPGARD